METQELNTSQLIALKKKTREANEQKFLESCKARLSKIISTKIQTSFIGALDVFEKSFGHLWAADEYGVRSPEAQRYYEIYQSIRTDVLNLGNNQKRAAQTEIAQHVISWSRYTMTMPVKPL